VTFLSSKCAKTQYQLSVRTTVISNNQYEATSIIDRVVLPGAGVIGRSGRFKELSGLCHQRSDATRSREAADRRSVAKRGPKRPEKAATDATGSTQGDEASGGYATRTLKPSHQPKTVSTEEYDVRQ